jgi:hypothetical protein
MHFHGAGPIPDVPRHGRVRHVVIIGIVEDIFFWQKPTGREHHHLLAILPPMTTTSETA